MAFSLATTWRQRWQQVEDVKATCSAILSHLALPDTDARAKAMIQVRQACNTLALVPLRLQHLSENACSVLVILQVLGLEKADDLRSILTDLNKNSKAALLVVVQFALEGCVAAVLEALGETCVLSFTRNVRRLSRVTLGPSSNYEQDVLVLPAYIRNTLHASGVHLKDDWRISVDGADYVFEKGKRPQCCTWSHILHAISHALGVYQRVFLTPEVARIKSIPAR